MALVVYFGVGGVDIFGSLFFGGEDASAEPQHAARDAIDGEHDAATKTVIAFAFFFEYGETTFLKHLVGIAVASGMVGEVAPFVEAIAETEGVDDLVA